MSREFNHKYMFIESITFEVIKKLDSVLLTIENRSNIYVTSILVGSFLLCICSIYVMPHFDYLTPNGYYYAELSKNPCNFNTNNPVQLRILAPFLGYSLGINGKLFFVLPYIFKVLFPATIYANYRNKLYSANESFIITSLICFSNVYLISIYYTYYTDIVTYFFIFLSYSLFNRSIIISGICFLLAMLNHESTLFILAPMLSYFLISKQIGNRSNSFFIVSCFSLALILYYFFRSYITSMAEIEYDFDYYLNRNNIKTALRYITPNLPIGIFYVFKLLWIFPCIAFIRSFNQGKLHDIFILILFITIPVIQIVVAYDTTRLLCLSFPVMLIAWEKIRDFWQVGSLKKFAVQILFFNLFVPQYFFVIQGAIYQWSLPAIILKNILKDFLLFIINAI